MGAGLREPSGEQILALLEKYDVVVPKEVRRSVTPLVVSMLSCSVSRSTWAEQESVAGIDKFTEGQRTSRGDSKEAVCINNAGNSGSSQT